MSSIPQLTKTGVELLKWFAAKYGGELDGNGHVFLPCPECPETLSVGLDARETFARNPDRQPQPANGVGGREPLH